MVSLRCKMIVQEKLLEVGILKFKVELGIVKIFEDITQDQLAKFKCELPKYGLEIMDNKRVILVERIKTVIIQAIHHDENLPKVKFSVFISEKLGYNYTYLANIFSAIKGITIIQFIIIQKVEKVKELLIYDELCLAQIADKLNYSSAAALSNQFKKISGFTISNYKKLKEVRILNLENV